MAFSVAALSSCWNLPTVSSLSISATCNVPLGGADMRIAPKATFAAKSATAIMAGAGDLLRSLAAIPAANAPRRNVTPTNPTSDAVWINSGAPISADEGDDTAPPDALNDDAKSIPAHSAAKANI